MNKGMTSVLVTVITCTLTLPVWAQITFNLMGTYESGFVNGNAATVLARDPGSQRLFVVNEHDVTIDVLDIRDPADPFLGVAPNFGQFIM